MNKDENIYRMVYCDYEEFGKKYLKTFPRLVFKIDDFEEEFEFTYKDLFKPIYDNKYYLFLIFTGRFWRASELIIQPPSYPWTLGRMFLKKYPFVFDSLNQKVGYYKTPKKNKTVEENINNINNNDNIIEKEEPKKDVKEETNLNLNKSDENKKEKNDKKLNEIKKEEKPKENKKTDNIFIIIVIIIFSIIIVIIIGIWYECALNKNNKKEKAQELDLIEKDESTPENEQKV
jgi:hypothetical protein